MFNFDHTPSIQTLRVLDTLDRFVLLEDSPLDTALPEVVGDCGHLQGHPVVQAVRVPEGVLHQLVSVPAALPRDVLVAIHPAWREARARLHTAVTVVRAHLEASDVPCQVYRVEAGVAVIETDCRSLPAPDLRKIVADNLPVLHGRDPFGQWATVGDSCLRTHPGALLDRTGRVGWVDVSIVAARYRPGLNIELRLRDRFRRLLTPRRPS